MRQPRRIIAFRLHGLCEDEDIGRYKLVSNAVQEKRHHEHQASRSTNIAANQQQADRFASELQQIRGILREGFRLPPEADKDEL